MARTVHGELPVAFHYTPGVGNTEFFEALRDEGAPRSRCEVCGVTYLPARDLSASDASRSSRPTRSAARRNARVVHDRLRRHRRRAARRLITIGLVKLDGADTVLMHRLLGNGPWQIGARVETVVSAERTGSILDVEGFRQA